MAFNRTGPGWRDLVTDIDVRGTAGSFTPDFTAWRTNFYAYEFLGTGTNRKECWANFHLDHDYMPGTELYIHIHYLNNVAGGSGDVKWYFDLTYAKRDSAAFSTPTTVSVVQAVSGTQYQHQVAEVASGLTVANFETDGILMARIYRDPSDAADTYANSLWGVKVDLHYQTDHMSTPNKASPFF